MDPCGAPDPSRPVRRLPGFPRVPRGPAGPPRSPHAASGRCRRILSRRFLHL